MHGHSKFDNRPFRFSSLNRATGTKMDHFPVVLSMMKFRPRHGEGGRGESSVYEQEYWFVPMSSLHSFSAIVCDARFHIRLNVGQPYVCVFVEKNKQNRGGVVC